MDVVIIMTNTIVNKMILDALSEIITAADTLTMNWAINKGLIADPNMDMPSEFQKKLQDMLNEGVFKGDQSAYLGRILSVIASKFEGKKIELKTVFDEAKKHQYKKGIVIVLMNNAQTYKAGDICLMTSDYQGLLINKVSLASIPSLFTMKWNANATEKIKIQNTRPATKDEIKTLFEGIYDTNALIDVVKYAYHD